MYVRGTFTLIFEYSAYSTFVSMCTFYTSQKTMVNKMAAYLWLKGRELILCVQELTSTPKLKTMCLWYKTTVGEQFDPSTAFTVHASQHVQGSK